MDPIANAREQLTNDGDDLPLTRDLDAVRSDGDFEQVAVENPEDRVEILVTEVFP